MGHVEGCLTGGFAFEFLLPWEICCAQMSCWLRPCPRYVVGLRLMATNCHWQSILSCSSFTAPLCKAALWSIHLLLYHDHDLLTTAL